MDVPLAVAALQSPVAESAQHVAPTPKSTNWGELVGGLLLEDYAPASVLIDRKYEVLYFHGPTDKYLHLPAGEPTRDLIAMARHGLRTKLRAGLRQAMNNQERVTMSGARVESDGKYLPVKITARPISESLAPDTCLLVSFEAEGEPAECVSSTSGLDDSVVSHLEDELKATREDLQGTIEELHSSNEELKASHEEVVSMNEELQSTNEELETSKEELQSLNEELTTVNAQLEEKLAELRETRDDLTNLLTSTDIGTIFLDRQLRIKRFTKPATQLFRLRSSDEGRPIEDITERFLDGGLQEDCQTVLKSLVPIEREVHTVDDRWYMQRILPYRTGTRLVEGLVVCFVDITSRRKAEMSEQVARRYAEGIVETVSQPLLVLDEDLRILSANQAFYRLFQVQPESVQYRSIFELGSGHWEIPKLRKLLERIIPEQSRVEDFQLAHDFPGLGRRTMLLNARQIARPEGQPDLILLAMQDVTERMRAEDELRQSEEGYRHLAHEKEELLEQVQRDSDTKTMLLKEVSHRVKNSLAGIIGLLRAQERFARRRARSSVPEIVADTVSRIEGLATVHQLLSSADWSSLQMNDLVEEVVHRSLHAVPSDKQVSLQFSFSPVSLTADQASSLALVLNELVTNTIKHTLESRQKARIRVHGGLETGKVQLTFQDDGPGYPEEALRLEHSGVGMYLVENIVRDNLQGTLKLRNDAGAVADITFPPA
jgi:PAS domain S-box-containing protein